MRPGQGTVKLLLGLTMLRCPGQLSITLSLAMRVPGSGCMHRYLGGHVANALSLVVVFPTGANSRPSRTLLAPPRMPARAGATPIALLLDPEPIDGRRLVDNSTSPATPRCQSDTLLQPVWRPTATLSPFRSTQEPRSADSPGSLPGERHERPRIARTACQSARSRPVSGDSNTDESQGNRNRPNQLGPVALNCGGRSCAAFTRAEGEGR